MCCLPYHNGPQNFTINFDNDQSNDQLTIYLSENALKGKYKLTLKNGAGRSQLVQYSIYRIDSGGEVRQLNFYFILAITQNQSSPLLKLISRKIVRNDSMADMSKNCLLV